MRLLIVGTLGGQLTTATKLAMEKGASVTHAENVDQALAVLRSGRGADLLMADVSLDIRDLNGRLNAEHIYVPIVACGVTNDARAAVNAIHAGAKEYIPLPPDPDLIAAVLAAVAEDTREMIYRDDSMAKVVKLAQQIAGSDASVLITGESGTGKEVLARFVHGRSNRSKKSFITVNCAAIPENLLESELFGHEKGAFTGALARRIGKFEEANGGTLLLDEISEMEVRLQSKLLRAIQERVIDRVGGNRPVPVDIRIIATSNRNLTDAVREGKFREDLLFRLNVVNLKIPPLRERPANWRITSYVNILKRTGCLCGHCQWKRAVRSAPTVGQAMSASLRTRCIVPCCFRAARRSVSTAFFHPTVHDSIRRGAQTSQLMRQSPLSRLPATSSGAPWRKSSAI
jgi:two-component system, response regulator FlrC